jgi:microcystin-dependent protein
MSDPFIGEIQPWPLDFCPYGWLPCDGRLLTIQPYQALFSLIGVIYGGDGRNNFKLPNLIGRVVMGQGQGPGLSNRTFASTVGSPTVALTVDEIPLHSHDLQVGLKNAANATPGPSATSNVLIDPSFSGFLPPPANTALAPSVGITGLNTAHPNAQPTLALIYCIAYLGEYPMFD